MTEIVGCAPIRLFLIEEYSRDYRAVVHILTSITLVLQRYLYATYRVDEVRAFI